MLAASRTSIPHRLFEIKKKKELTASTTDDNEENRTRIKKFEQTSRFIEYVTV